MKNISGYLNFGAAFAVASWRVLYVPGAGVHTGMLMLGSDLSPLPIPAAGELYK